MTITAWAIQDLHERTLIAEVRFVRPGDLRIKQRGPGSADFARLIQSMWRKPFTSFGPTDEDGADDAPVSGRKEVVLTERTPNKLETILASLTSRGYDASPLDG